MHNCSRCNVLLPRVFWNSLYNIYLNSFYTCTHTHIAFAHKFRVRKFELKIFKYFCIIRGFCAIFVLFVYTIQNVHANEYAPFHFMCCLKFESLLHNNTIGIFSTANKNINISLEKPKSCCKKTTGRMIKKVSAKWRKFHFEIRVRAICLCVANCALSSSLVAMQKCQCIAQVSMRLI